MNEAVDHRGSDDVIAEDLAPAAEGLVGRADQRGAFVAPGDEHEHEVRGLGIERDVADLVDDQQRDPLQAVELGVQAALALGVGEQRDKLIGDDAFDWVTSLAALHLTAARVAHATGRYERASLIVTSNKPFSAWGDIFGDEVTAAAMIDRLVHHAEILALKGDSYRLKDRDLARPPAEN